MAVREDNGDTWCVHRTPLTHEYRVCQIGLDFRQFFDTDPDWMDRVPCLGRCTERCGSYQARTPEQNARRRKLVSAAIEKLLVDHPELKE